MCIPGSPYYGADQPADLLRDEEAHDKLTVSYERRPQAWVAHDPGPLRRA